MGNTTNTNDYGIEINCLPITRWRINDTVYCIADSIYENSGNSTLQKQNMVLSGHGDAANWLKSNIQTGDTIGLFLKFDGAPQTINSMIGGFPQIINDGKNFVDEGYALENGPSHTYERHPRTAVGYNNNHTKLYMITVNGRQDISIGMTLPELADFMLNLGVHKAINLDGGGSTTLVANHKIANAPSDISGERLVSNSLLVISNAPKGNINYIKIQPYKLNLRFGSSQKINLSAFDEFNNLVKYDTSAVNWNITGNIGLLDKNNVFWANGKEFNGYIKANYTDFSDSIRVVIEPIETFTLNPSQITTDSITPVKLKAFAKNLNTTLFEIDPHLLNWKVVDENIGTVSDEGVFAGIKKGKTQVIAKIGNVQASAEITVEIFYETVLLDAMETIDSWIVSSSFLDTVHISLSDNNFTEGMGGMEIHYEFTYNGRMPYIVLQNEIPVPGMPDSIWADIKSNTEDFRLSFNLSTQKYYNNLTYSPIITPLYFKSVGALLKAIDLTEYPYIFKEIKIEIWKNEDWELDHTYTGSIYLDNLRVSYPGHNPIISVANSKKPIHIENLFIYPNPVNTFANITFNLKQNTEYLIIDIVSLNGKNTISTQNYYNIKKGKQKHQLNLKNIEQGIYIIRIKTKDDHLSGKILVN